MDAEGLLRLVKSVAVLPRPAAPLPARRAAAPERPNVFVLCTGRCGSTTFAAAAGHATNFTAGHETRTHLTGPDRLAYPPGHIEADNRLSWLLGRLEAVWGDRAVYVHLTRDPEAVARSFERRFDRGIIRAYHTEILMGAPRRSRDLPPIEFCRDYVATVTANIEAFLRGKSRVHRVRLESAKQDFAAFWQAIGAEGDLAAALAEWDIRHNASPGAAPAPVSLAAQA